MFCMKTEHPLYFATIYEPDCTNRQTYMKCQTIIRRLLIWIKWMYNGITSKRKWFVYLHNRISLITEAVIAEIIGWDNQCWLHNGDKLKFGIQHPKSFGWGCYSDSSDLTTVSDVHIEIFFIFVLKKCYFIFIQNKMKAFSTCIHVYILGVK